MKIIGSYGNFYSAWVDFGKVVFIKKQCPPCDYRAADIAFIMENKAGLKSPCLVKTTGYAGGE